MKDPKDRFESFASISELIRKKWSHDYGTDSVEMLDYRHLFERAAALARLGDRKWAKIWCEEGLKNTACHNHELPKYYQLAACIYGMCGDSERENEFQQKADRLDPSREGRLAASSLLRGLGSQYELGLRKPAS